MRRIGDARFLEDCCSVIKGVKVESLQDPMPTLDDVYRKFGEASEAAQLLETELGNVLLKAAVDEGLLIPVPMATEADRKRARELVDHIDRQTLGQLIRQTKRHTAALTQLEPLLAEALEERNRLSHRFYPQHNFRRNSDTGRLLMMTDLESIHDVLLKAYEAILLLSGIDLDALVEKSSKTNEGDEGADIGPTAHLPI